jgi:8-oxo-dGTP diphosphatase
MENNIEDVLLADGSAFHPGLSVDCVIFGFHANQLKVLLLKMKHTDHWALPGGFVYKEEDVEAAASRVLEARTGLKNVFLRQFYLFGQPERSRSAFNRNVLQARRGSCDDSHWFLQRFITLGFYALVDFSKAIPQVDAISDACQWWDLDKVPVLILDHNQILQKALETLRIQLNYQPIGCNLLPATFTMPELQKLYETILGKKLDRRNFQRKILGFDILERLEERRIGVAHKAPYLYRFEQQKYQQALEHGLRGGW